MIDLIPLIGIATLVVVAGGIVVAHRSGFDVIGALAEGLFVVPMALFVGAVALLSVVAMIGIPVMIGAIALHLTGGHFLVWIVFAALTLLAAWVALVDLRSV